MPPEKKVQTWEMCLKIKQQADPEKKYWLFLTLHDKWRTMCNQSATNTVTSPASTCVTGPIWNLVCQFSLWFIYMKSETGVQTRNSANIQSEANQIVKVLKNVTRWVYYQLSDRPPMPHAGSETTLIWPKANWEVGRVFEPEHTKQISYLEPLVLDCCPVEKALFQHSSAKGSSLLLYCSGKKGFARRLHWLLFTPYTRNSGRFPKTSR